MRSKAASRSELAVVLLTVLALAGCGLFEPRDPETPAVLRSTFDPPTEPLTVLNNMSAAFRELNSVNYLRCLSDSSTGGTFTFDPVPSAAAKYGAFISWTRSNEEEYFLNIRSRLPASTTMTLVFGTPTLQGAQTDSVQVDVSYDLSVPHGQAGVPQSGKGRSLFMMVLDRRTGFWSVRRWSDFAPSTPGDTWSDIKGAFAQ